MADYNRHSSQTQPLKVLGWLLTGGTLVVILFVGVDVLRERDRLLANFQSLLKPAPTTPNVDVQSLIVRQIRGASDLTTAVYTMQAVVPTTQDNAIGGFVLGTTKLLYIAHGEVRAGVDLSRLSPGDVQVVGDAIQLQLPPPQLLDSKIDVNRSSIYDYNRGFLDLGPDVGPTLQTMAQRQALSKIVEAACSDGILQQASDRAQLVVTQLLTTAGYKQVTVDAPPVTNRDCLISANTLSDPRRLDSTQPAPAPSVSTYPKQRSSPPDQPPASDTWENSPQAPEPSEAPAFRRSDRDSQRLPQSF